MKAAVVMSPSPPNTIEKNTRRGFKYSRLLEEDLSRRFEAQDSQWIPKTKTLLRKSATESSWLLETPQQRVPLLSPIRERDFYDSHYLDHHTQELIHKILISERSNNTKCPPRRRVVFQKSAQY